MAPATLIRSPAAVTICVTNGPVSQEGGVATVPGSSFYSNKEDGRKYTRFAFCKTFDTLKRAEKRLRALDGLLK